MRILDLFCGAGGAGMGYHLSGFDVVGVDITNQKEYPFEFIEGDAIEYALSHGHEFDAIHASPPCQHFTKYGNCRKDIKDRYQDLLDPTRDVLKDSGVPYVIENVVGAPLIDPIVLCGSMFGLDVQRHRLFESNVKIKPPGKCNHKVWEPNRFPGGRSRERGHARVLCRGTVEIGRWNIKIEVQQKAMGIDWIKNLRMLSQSIPPAYTKWIGLELKSLARQKALIS